VYVADLTWVPTRYILYIYKLKNIKKNKKIPFRGRGEKVRARSGRGARVGPRALRVGGRPRAATCLTCTWVPVLLITGLGLWGDAV